MICYIEVPLIDNDLLYRSALHIANDLLYRSALHRQ